MSLLLRYCIENLVAENRGVSQLRGRIDSYGRKVGHSFAKGLVDLYQRVIADFANRSLTSFANFAESDKIGLAQQSQKLLYKLFRIAFPPVGSLRKYAHLHVRKVVARW